MSATNPVTSGDAIARSNSGFVVTTATNGVVTLFKEDDSSTGLTKLHEVKNIGGNGNQERAALVEMFGRTVYVARGSSITVFRIVGSKLKKVKSIKVGLETHGLALSPNGTRLYATSMTEDKVFEIDTAKLRVSRTIDVNGHPMPVLVTDDGDRFDEDERVFVAIHFSRLPAGQQKGTNQGGQGVIVTWPVNAPQNVQEVTVAAVADVGFRKDITAFCAVGTNGAEAFCNPADIGGDQANAIEGGYPNMLRVLAAEGDFLYIFNTGASPAPPVSFNTNVQSFVNVININTLVEDLAKFRNLNAAVTGEPVINNTFTGLFLTDISAATWVNDAFGKAIMAAVRNGGFLVRIPVDANGNITLAQPNIARYPVGHMPEGVLFSNSRQRFYTYNNIGRSVTVSRNPDPANVPGAEVAQTLLNRNVFASQLPKIGSVEHKAMVGWLMFITGLGIPDNGVFNTNIRRLNTLAGRGKASDNNWSSCASCHGPYGLTDNVTWIFATGPRQTVPTDQSAERFDEKHGPTLVASTGRSRAWSIMNFNDVRASTTDFNNNARGVQGGTGHQPNPADIFNHGPVTEGVSEAIRSWLDFVDHIVRSYDMPKPNRKDPNFARGREVFATNCASCHGGGLWTSGDALWGRSDPTRVATNVAPVDPNVNLPAGTNTVIDFTNLGQQVIFRKNVGTFVGAGDFRERRGAGGAIGALSLGAPGFGAPSLMTVGLHAPYLHNGDAQDFDQLFALHRIPDEAGQLINAALPAADLTALKVYLGSIDSRSTPVIFDANGNIIPENEIVRRATGCPTAATCNP